MRKAGGLSKKEVCIPNEILSGRYKAIVSHCFIDGAKPWSKKGQTDGRGQTQRAPTDRSDDVCVRSHLEFEFQEWMKEKAERRNLHLTIVRGVLPPFLELSWSFSPSVDV